MWLFDANSAATPPMSLHDLWEILKMMLAVFLAHKLHKWTGGNDSGNSTP